MPPSLPSCGFCGRPRNEVKSLVSATGDNGPFICDRCVKQSYQAITTAAQREEAVKEAPLPKPREIRGILDDHVIAQEKAKTDISVAVYEHYKRREATRMGTQLEEGVEPQKSNILLLGPSGTGKTEIARTIAKMLRVPFYVGDATRLTQAGYVGDDVETLLQGLIQAADGDVERAQWGILFLDEIDKLARKSGRGATGYRDVTGEGVQQALLKMLEGSKVVIPQGHGRMVLSGTPQNVIDTSNVLFIGAGSFAGIEEVISKRVNKSAGIGFGAADRKKLSLSEIYSQVTEDDVLEFGLIPEMMGRLPVITSTLELNEEEMVRILTEPRNSLVKQFRALYSMDGIDLQFDEGALRAIGREAKKRPTGARALISIITSVLQPYTFELPSDPTVTSLRITEETVTKGALAIVMHRVAATA